ncbi:MAG: hypothetical protein BJ554DRAFT_3283 [Olpidium bornovanus]|uniref:Serine/threonine-protein phosphatase 4 regulatory subunit 3-like central domain-containing protein n=1 Tax=Olpidium bornovanus TaxID=278681 RepID=A0A8H8A1B1_9FUNG|nr:MAG: hypothetical protein BJ554DRAFT_3283 [Olpidium bornovanus]
MRNHSFRAKQFVLSNNVSQKVALLLRARDKSVRLSAIRYFRTIVAAKDEFYNRHLIKHDLFAPIVKTFLETEHKNNLVNSACIELFEFIRRVGSPSLQENIKSLVEHIWRGFGHHFEGITYVDTFQAFQKRYEQNVDAKLGTASIRDADADDGDQKYARWPSSMLDDEEERYFDGSDDEDSAQTVNEGSTRPGGALVDYPDDDDDDGDGRPVDTSKAAEVTPPISPAKNAALPRPPPVPKAAAAEEKLVELPPLKRSRGKADEDDDEDDVFLAASLRRTTGPVISIRFSAKAVGGSNDRGAGGGDGGGGGGEKGKADAMDIETDDLPSVFVLSPPVSL